MKRLVVASVIMLTVLSGTLLASHGNVGLGVQFGEPSGITAKFWLAGQSAIDLTVGWNLIVDYLGIQAGYLYHFPVPISGKGDLAPYIGLGGQLGMRANDYFNVAGRIPLGLEFIYAPISFYGELDPLIYLYPATDVGLGGGIGLRFYF